MAYVKLFSTILDSTIWEASIYTKIVWITMLAMSDRDGYVGASVPGLAKRAGVTREDCEAALNNFLSPDPDSRTKDFEGRRITVADGGWTLLNHGKYRDLLSREDKKEKTRERVRKFREKHPVKKNVTQSNAGNDMHLISSHLISPTNIDKKEGEKTEPKTATERKIFSFNNLAKEVEGSLDQMRQAVKEALKGIGKEGTTESQLDHWVEHIRKGIPSTNPIEASQYIHWLADHWAKNGVDPDVQNHGGRALLQVWREREHPRFILKGRA